MKILIVCPYFPPENTIAAVRVGKFAHYLAEAGDSVRVITCFPSDFGLSPVDEAGLDVGVLRSRDPLMALKKFARRRGGFGVGSRRPQSPEHRGVVKRGLHALASVARALFLMPDPYIYWAPGALAATRLSDWRPDVVVASGRPISAFIVGRTLARRYEAPWLADYRDLLTSGPYYECGRVRRVLDGFIERRVVASASAVTTVSEPLARDLERYLTRPVQVILNGFDPCDFPSPGDATKEPSSNTLVITHCGEIYPGRRDPTNLFKAVRILRDEGHQVEVRFYGGLPRLLSSLAKRFEVEDCVIYHPRVDHAESLKRQTEADVLLLLMWDNPNEQGVYTGKLFEYIGARRPILLIGYAGSVAANLVRERKLGVVATEVGDIADSLRSWIRAKETLGSVAPTPLAAQRGLTRKEQTATLREILADSVVRARARL